jgi:uncharacterized membrane protein YsdA (DUF1294 family)
MTVLLAYCAAVNLIAFWTMGHDKARSRKKGWRVPEKRLFAIAAIGGAIGMWAGMKVFRHKTKHLSFALGIPVLAVVNLAAFIIAVVSLRPVSLG